VLPPGAIVTTQDPNIADPPDAAAREIRTAFPKARGLHEHAQTLGTASEEATRGGGFDIIPTPSTALPNHQRITQGLFRRGERGASAPLSSRAPDRGLTPPARPEPAFGNRL
jgi:hypothetical protein